MIKHFLRNNLGALLLTCGLAWLSIFASAFVQLGPVTNSTSSGLATSVVFRTSDAVRNNTDTLTADDTLLFPISGNSGDWYDLEILLDYMASSTADFKMALSVPAGTAGETVAFRVATTSGGCGGTTTQMYVTANESTPIEGAGVGVAARCSMMVKGYLISGATAGDVVLTWAQNTLDATNVTLLTGSRIFYRKIN